MSTSAQFRGAAQFTSEEERFAAIRQRDARADGSFFYSVITTGVYCRPSCGARLPRVENVAFHTSAEAAERAGFRACKRCKPREPSRVERHLDLIRKLRAQLESPDAEKQLSVLAAQVGMSPFHVQRLFKQHVGMTPREYAAAHRLRRAEAALRAGSTVTGAIYDAGFASSGRFYEATAALGMTASELKRGAAGLKLCYLVRPCALGQVLIATSERGVCAIAFGDREQALVSELRARFPRAELSSGEHDASLIALADRLVPAIAHAEFPTDVPLDLIGTAFQQRVWRALLAIPRGQTRSYAQLANEIGAPGAARAVGKACGDNPVAGLVPCHRVLRGDGQLSGYRWGLDRKRQLLARERE